MIPIDKQQLESLRNAYDQAPDDRDNGVKLAQYYADLGWYNEAIELYKELMSKFNHDYGIILEYGNICFNRQDYQGAFTAFTQLTDLKPEKLEGWNNLGIVHLTRGDVGAARRCFEKVLEIEPDNYGALLNLGNYYDQKEDVDKAIEFFEKAADARNDFADAWFNLGNSYIKARRLEDAVSAYEKAVKFQPEFFSAIKNLGVAFEYLDQKQKALDCYMQALELNKADAGIYMNVASIYTKQREFDKAKDYLLRSVRLSPKSPAAWMGLRELSLLKGDIETYVKSTLAIIHRLDADIIADSILKLNRLQQHKYVDEILKLADKLGKQSDLLDAQRLLAYKRKNYSGGKIAAIYKRLISLEDAPDAIRSALAEFSMQNKRYDETVRQVEKIHLKDNSSLKLQWQALIGRGEVTKAERQIRKYLLSHQGCPECWYLLAVIAVKRDRMDEARGHLTKAAENGFADLDMLSSQPALAAIYDEIVSYLSAK